MVKFKRQVAKFLFAKEIAGSKVSFTEESEDSQYSSVHVVTPTGQDVGRVFICGTMTEVEDIGSETSYFKGRLIDPTGAINVYAGQYQPEAAETMGGLDVPIHIAVVGKISLFTTEDGTVIPTIRAEDIAEINEDTIRSWTFMAARNLIEHIEDAELTDTKKTAFEEYGNVTDDFTAMAMNALKSLLPTEPHDKPTE